MLQGIDKNTVDFTPNFGDTELEPTVLPARFPNLLVNGARGFLQDGRQKFLPTRREKSSDAVIYRIKHPRSSVGKVDAIY